MRTTNRYELSGTVAIIRNARKSRSVMSQDWKNGERPAPGRDYKNRSATRRGQSSDQSPGTRWARIAVREHRRATFWLDVLDSFKARREDPES